MAREDQEERDPLMKKLRWGNERDHFYHMGSLQLEPANIIRPSTSWPSSPLQASDFDEERYLVGGARNFYMNDARGEERVDKKKVSGVSYGDERKERRSSGYGDEQEKRVGGDSGLGCLQHEKKSIPRATLDNSERKNKIYYSYGEELQKKATIREPSFGGGYGDQNRGSFGSSEDEKKQVVRGNIDAIYNYPSRGSGGDVYGDQWRRKRGSFSYDDDGKKDITRGIHDGYGDESNKAKVSFSDWQEGHGDKEKRGRVDLHTDEGGKRETWSAYEGEEKTRGKADLKRDQGDKRERWSANGGEEEKKKEEQGEKRERWRGVNGGEEQQGEKRERSGNEGEKEEEQGERWSGNGGEKEEEKVDGRERWGEEKEKKEEEEGGSVDYVHRGQWLRAAILGANDGLVSTASLMMGVGAVKDDDPKAMIISGLAGLVGGACSMAIGEFVSVYSQRDAETFDNKNKKKELDLEKPSSLGDHKIKDLEEGKSTFAKFSPREGKSTFGKSFPRDEDSKEGSPAFTNNKDSIRGGSHVHKQDIPSLLAASHANKQDVLNGGTKEESKKQGKKEEEESSVGPSPWEAAGVSGLSFALGAMVPLLSASFIKDHTTRLGVMMGVSSAALVCMGSIGAKLSAGGVLKGGIRVLLGGWVAMLVTYGLLRLFGTSGM